MSLHVLQQLERHRKHGGTNTPLFVAVQGPQGSGKTFLTSRLRDVLSSPPHSLSVTVLSIDDLYLPHAGLVAVAQANPQNRLLQGRGQPGTHDVPLGTHILEHLKHVNTLQPDDPKAVVSIPSFDKSLFNGEGDRIETGHIVRPPVDVVVLEGWCVGFYPSTPGEITRRWELPVPGLGEDFFGMRGFRKEDVLEVNEKLKELSQWWSFFGTFIQIKPDETHPYEYIYKWRLQQEHNMKMLNGGQGMTDTQVEKFVDRYIPGYVFFGDGILRGVVTEDGQQLPPPWLGNGLCVQIGEERETISVSNF
ncbi:P-loop containing nucleoside triphosphate hydrolase protein [Trametopsis cervina]|nr:P-loop containing nucleoside triphosphate hydrolase protein [Trametopsis cervina]